MMENCLVCFQAVETDIFVPPDECIKLFNNFLVSLHSSIAEKNEIPFLPGDQFPFCKMCFDSAFQLNQVNEQLSAYQKKLSDLIVEFSLSVLYRRSQTSSPMTVGNDNTRNKSIEQTVEINASGLPHKLFSFNNSKNRCEDEKTVEDATHIIIPGNPNEVDIVTPNYQEIEVDVNDNSAAEYSAQIEHEDLFIFPNQNPVETENIKLELNYDSICNSNVIVTSNTMLFSCPPETDDGRNCCTDNKIELQKQDDHSTTLMDAVEYDNDPLCSTRHESRGEGKSTEIKGHSSKTGNNEIKTKSQLLAFDRIPSVTLKRIQLDQIGVTKGGPRKILKSEVENNSTTFHSNWSPGRSKKTKIFKRRKRAKNVMTGGVPVPCEFCNKVFQNNSRMEEHKRTHTGERPYQCPFCPKTYKRMGHLNVHKKGHTGVRPYKCYYCSLHFFTSSSRRLHQLTHPGGSRYKCNLCLKTFNAESTWQKHVPFCHPKEHE